MMEKNIIGELDNRKYSYIHKGGNNPIVLKKALFSVSHSKKFSENISQFFLKNDQYKIFNNQGGIEWIGRYFEIKISQTQSNKNLSKKLLEKRRLYTSVLSMSEESIERRNKLFKIANQTEILNFNLELENLK
jgi:hypothetical protein